MLMVSVPCTNLLPLDEGDTRSKACLPVHVPGPSAAVVVHALAGLLTCGSGASCPPSRCCLTPVGWAKTRRLQLRGQCQIFTGFPLRPRVASWEPKPPDIGPWVRGVSIYRGHIVGDKPVDLCQMIANTTYYFCVFPVWSIASFWRCLFHSDDCRNLHIVRRASALVRRCKVRASVRELGSRCKPGAAPATVIPTRGTM